MNEVLARLVGAWSGEGRGVFPTIEAFTFRETLTVEQRDETSLLYVRKWAHRLWLDVFEHNERARALYTSEGFTVEGVLREHVNLHGQWRSLVVMSMLSREYVDHQQHQVHA